MTLAAVKDALWNTQNGIAVF